MCMHNSLTKKLVISRKVLPTKTFRSASRLEVHLFPTYANNGKHKKKPKHVNVIKCTRLLLVNMDNC